MNTNTFIVSDIMSKDIIAVSPDTGAKKAAEVMLKNKISSLVVREGSHVVGIVTDKDFVRLTSMGKDIGKVRVKEMMSTELVTVNPKLSLQEASEVLRDHDIRHLLVKAPGGYVGIVSLKDILSTLYKGIKEQNTKLKNKIDELEKFYKAAVGRELVMVKLKKRLRELEKRLGEESDLTEILSAE
ncbi:MAG: CBS domain-containing protein [Candidatus Hydrothermarchaeales archaeon]